MPCHLLTTPTELLVQRILARLDLPTLRSCSSTCKHLNVTIKASALLHYLIKLQEMNLIDNPAVSHNDIPLAKRMEMLRQYGVPQEIQWNATSALLASKQQSSPLIKGEAGVLYVLPKSLETQELHWTILPSKLDQVIELNSVRPSNHPSAKIAAHALSIEENDLIAFATRHEEPQAISGNSNFFQIQIHLIQHSTQLPYPGLASPILDICTFQRMYGDYPVVYLAIRGTNLAVMVGHESLQEIMDQDPSSWIGNLSVWNWKTGEKRCEKKDIPDKDMNLVFLREDILLHVSSLTPSLNIYHIPTSNPLTGDHNLCLIECLGLPTLEKKLNDPDPNYHPEYNLSISFLDNPTVVPSFTESSNPTVPRLFAADTLSSILTFEVTFEEYVGSTSYLFITHHRTLLGRAEDALSRYKNGEGVTASLVPWEEWGPDVTKMFWYNHDLCSLDTPYGSRLYVQSDDLIEVYDFGVSDGTVNSPNQGHKESQTPSALRWLVEQDEYGQGVWFQDIVQTKLPFVRRILKVSIDGDWDTMYVDHSRIVGIQDDNRIDVLYIG